ncbi:MAG: ATP-binding cassette domain-containing protein [Actinobacteria bacterium]|nr:ATP-binding cassette domain-containing protein [Actinomycetota bacterium]
MLELVDVCKHYGSTESDGGTVQALQDVSLSVKEGEFVSIIGSSGCGKSTLLEIVAGLVPASTGELRIHGERVDGPNPRVGMVFQEESTFPWLTAQANVEFGLRAAGVSRVAATKQAREMLHLVGLHGFENHYPDQLSGGMRQRVAIARALVTRPEVILMDEPFGALDEQTRIVLGEELLRLWQGTGSTVLFVTHSLSEAAMLADRIAVLSSRPGRIIELIEVTLPRPRSSEIIGTPAFTAITGQLWKHLQREARRSAGLEDVRAQQQTAEADSLTLGAS